MPHLVNAGGNVNKQWYVEYSVRNPESGELERIRIYEGINRFSTCGECYDAAKKIIRKIKAQIRAGNIGYKEFTDYDDLLLYDGQSRYTSKRKARKGKK